MLVPPQHNNLEHDLPSRITEFMSIARQQGFVIGVNETLDAQALARDIGILNKRGLRYGLKALMCNDATDWQRFDQLFHFYWQSDNIKVGSFETLGGRGARKQSGVSEKTGSSATNNKRRAAHFDIPDAHGLAVEGASESTLSEAGQSLTQSTGTQSFEHLQDPVELRRMEDLAEQLAVSIRKRFSRRQRLNQRGQFIDLRHTIHSSLRHQGLPLHLSYKRRRQKPPKLLLLLDVSRSMNVYSYFFLRFARGILGAFKQADAFAFHTHLVHIGDTLRDPSIGRLAEKMSLISAGWGGGTRIGESLQSFNLNYSKLLSSHSIVIIVSDGYDTGEPQNLVQQLRRIKARARKLVWLNPLLGRADYSPETKCMKAALPLLDVFLPANNLSSLAALEEHLL